MATVEKSEQEGVVDRAPQPQQANAVQGRQKFSRRQFLFRVGTPTTIIGGAALAGYPLYKDSPPFLALKEMVFSPSLGERIAEREKELEKKKVIAKREFSENFETESPERKKVLEAIGMTPGNELLATANYDGVAYFSPINTKEHPERGVTLREDQRSIWLKQLPLSFSEKTGRTYCLLPPLVPHTPEVLSALRAANMEHNILLNGNGDYAVHTTNSWGGRGEEPDVEAQHRVLVLGDSQTQGFNVGDADAPPAQLQDDLKRMTGESVSVLNTGFTGYAPPQYYSAMKEFGERFNPHTVVAIAFPNDFHDSEKFEGTYMEEAVHYFELIRKFAEQELGANFYICAVPFYMQMLENMYKGYPNHFIDKYSDPNNVINPIDSFRKRYKDLGGGGLDKTRIFNGFIDDPGHCSPIGTDILANEIATVVASKNGRSSAVALNK